MGFNQTVYVKLQVKFREIPLGFWVEEGWYVICGASKVEHSESLHLSTLICYKVLH